ncbi:RCC1-like domain-containing protein [Melittangium boletus]|uniref:RCC1-like domain-containing protein n=1 Tax=Melittangium boletus TaxID=83453 RepID=UPI003DA6444C
MRRRTFSRMALLLTFCAPLAWASSPEDAGADDVARQTLAPPTWRTLTAGYDTSMGLAGDGSVWVWGCSVNMEFGLGDAHTCPAAPVRVPGLKNIVSVAVSDFHGLALGLDGRVWVSGQASWLLGLGAPANQPTFVPIPGLTQVRAIIASDNHSLALRADGTVWGWGTNDYGQLGPLATYVLTPTQIPGLSEVTSIAAGNNHSLAVRKDGTVWAWGNNSWGALGDGTQDSRATPAPVPGLTDIVAVHAADHDASLAVSRQGTVWAWGFNNGGVLGLGEQVYMQTTPAPVPGLTRVRALATNESSALAMRWDGSVWGWGTTRSHPAPLPPRVAPGVQHTPVEVPALRGAVDLAQGHGHGLMRRLDGSVWGWGDDNWGAVGLGRAFKSSPVRLPNLQGVTTSVFAGYTTFALKQDGTVWAWGVNSLGQLGRDAGRSSPQPTPVPGLTDVTSLAFTTRPYAARADGSVWTWGATLPKPNGQPGEPPHAVQGLSDIRAVSGTGSFTLALGQDGRVWAWGSNTQGQLGDGTTTARATPALVPGLSGIEAISAHNDYALALGGDGRVWAWGNNGRGLLGDGTTTRRLTPLLVPGLTDVTHLHAGGSLALARRADGSLWGWGVRSIVDPQLPPGPYLLTSPTPITGMTNVVRMAVGEAHALALRADGRLWAWGSNFMGQLGRSTYDTDVHAPAPVPGLSGVVSFSAGAGSSQAVLSDGSVHAWGNNHSSLLGDGVSNQLLFPERVLSLFPRP